MNQNDNPFCLKADEVTIVYRYLKGKERVADGRLSPILKQMEAYLYDRLSIAEVEALLQIDRG